MNFKKILAFLLAAQMLLVSAASCGNNEKPAETKKPANETTAPVGGTDAEETKEPAETEYSRLSESDDLPEINFNDRDFRFVVNEGEMFQLVSDDTSGVGLEAVIYDRNKRVEDRFGVKISAFYQMGTESQDVINSYVNVGEHIAEVCDQWHRMGLTPPCYGEYLNWLEFNYINWDKPWWNKKANESSYIKGKQFTVTSDLAVTAMLDTWIFAFNMELLEEQGKITSDEMYQIVLDGEWTIDKLIEIGSSIYKDVDGDGNENRGDIFGYACDASDRTMPWVTSIGENFFTVTEDRQNVEITLGTEKVYSALEKLVNFHHNVIGTYTYVHVNDPTAGTDISETPREFAEADFTNGNIALFPTRFERCFDKFTDVNFTYGMIPFPKYDTAQEMYLTVPEYDFSVYGVPTTLPFEDYDMIGIIMEALSAESWKTVSPAYYDEALKGRYSADETTAEIVDMIMEGRVFDWGYQLAQFLVCKIPYEFCYKIRENNTDLASRIAEGWDDTNARVQDVLTFYED